MSFRFSVLIGAVSYEKAFAYKLKMKALSHPRKRTDLTSSQATTKLNTAAEIENCSDESKRYSYYYISKSTLSPELLDLMGEGQFALMVSEIFEDKMAAKSV